ncbi:T9SS type B sorting domain-containing protein [Winogradskyella sp. SYSU M77433]|uniref:T9SS type B sorting domain-containing protein n=1 Tax=Winogradskyella sp. SYSU M77433 TaxID=3042722 RepID=UPI002480386B|nr:T9SS type B sorting domain-containing protein [Winogradskyella sp. SYSU M77433]MDH7911269.1 T9SS type B sorting domain-containing protein [Winogradskyella sp. SYSU M77433]
MVVSRKYTLVLLLFVTFCIFPQDSSNECNVTTINYDFEEPNHSGIYPLFINQNSMPGWNTTASDGQIELWPSPNFENVPAYSGSQFVELNANVVSGLYQDYDSPEGTIFNYGFAHRGRQGTDTCQLLAGPPGGPYVNVGPPVSTGNTSWSYNTGTYTVPAGQPITRFIFQSVNGSSGDNSVGNFLDSISFTAELGILTEGPIEIYCGDEAVIESLGGGTWIASPDNPSATTISNVNSNNITITGFSVFGDYVYEWDSVYCTSSITITYGEGFVEPPVVEDVFFCQNSVVDSLDVEPIEDYTLNWYSDSSGNTPLAGEPVVDTSVVSQTTYYVSQQTTNGCESDLVPIVVTVDALPIAETPFNIEVCDDSSNDGFSVFDLVPAGLQALGTQDPNTFNISYHLSYENAEIAEGDITSAGAYQNEDPQTQIIYVRIENVNNTSCYDISQFSIIVNPYESPNFSYAPNCYGAEISSVDEAGGIFSFSETPTDSANINPTTGEITNATPGETYSVEYITGGNCPNTAYVDVEVYTLPQIIDPTPLEVCDDAVSDGLTSMDLTIKNNEITGGNSGYSVSYYETQYNADNDIDSLEIPYTNTSNDQEIYVRVENSTTGCYDTTTLILSVEQAPAAITPTALEFCDPDSDGFGSFDISSKDDEITNGDNSLSVSYHETYANALNNVDAISSPYNNIVENIQTIYARVESLTIATDCATIVELELVVNPTPQLGFDEITPLSICDDESGDGFGQFDLTSKTSEITQNLSNPSSFIISFHETSASAEDNTNPIGTPGNYTNIDAFEQILWVRIEDNDTGCFKITTLDLEVSQLPVLYQPSPLELCDYDNTGDEVELFILETAIDNILNGQTGIQLVFYLTQEDADNNLNPITSPYANIENPQTVIVKGINNETGCSSTLPLTLRVNPIPSPTTPTDLEVCDEDNDGFSSFDLESKSDEIIGGELDVEVTYHETLEDANTGSNALASPYENIVIDTQTIYLRLTNVITGCYDISEQLTLRVLEKPEVPFTIEDYIICDADSDGTATFDLTTKDSEIIGSQTDVTLTYHITEADALSGNAPISNPSLYINSGNPQVIYVRLLSNITGCVDVGMFNIEVALPPEPIHPTPLELCDDDIADEITVFDLTVKNYEITGGQSSWSVAYYETEEDAQAQDNAINATAYTNTSINGEPANPQTLFVVVTDTDTGCTAQEILTIGVLPNPTPTEELPSLTLCDDVNSGDFQVAFDLTTNQNLLLNGELGVTPTYYESYEDAEDLTNEITAPESYTNISNPQTIYVRVTNDSTGCYTIVDFDILVNPLPETSEVSDMIVCEINTDDIYEFDLTLKNNEVLGDLDETLYTVTYHETQEDADSVQNNLVMPYTNTSNPQTIYIAITNNETGCSVSTVSFDVEVQEGALANENSEAIVYEICDDEIDFDNNSANNSAVFDLTPVEDISDLLPGSIQAQILDGQDPSNYHLSYYLNQVDAVMAENELDFLYENTVNPQQIWVRVDNNTLDGNGLDTSLCFDIAPLTLQVNPQPTFELESSYTLCLSADGNSVIQSPIIDTYLATPEYSFVWFYNGEEILGATEGSYEPTQAGTYSVIATDGMTSIETNCSSSASTEVVNSSPPLIEVMVNSSAFSENQIIEVNAVGLGNYEYSLDEGDWQDESIFTNVSIGEHLVTVRDKNGCGESIDSVIVIGYPKYFTPNGDTEHDTWNIVGLEDQSSAKIYIFDRYGKLIKQISPSGEGWNGTYNGNDLPTDDYWFLVEYREPGVLEESVKTFKAHFTLKR